jgi:hypothetical protein
VQHLVVPQVLGERVRDRRGAAREIDRRAGDARRRGRREILEEAREGDAALGDPLGEMPRPVLHVVITVKTTAAMTSGNQPPLGILSRLAPQKPRSTTRKTAQSAATAGRRHFQSVRATTAKRMVVNTMSVVTATP